MPIPGVAPRQLREAAARPQPRLGSAPPSTYHAPMVYAPSYHPAPAPQPQQHTWRSIPSSHPFAQAQHQAAQRVQQAERRLPQQRIYAPQLPIVPRPTQGQQYSAFAEAKRFQEQHIGAAPGRQRELQFHNEVAADPRNAGFIQALAHYIHAARIEGGTRTPFQLAGEGGARNVIDAAVSAAQGVSPRDRMSAEADQRRFEQEGAAMVRRQQLAAARQGPKITAGIPFTSATIDISPVVNALATAKLPGSGALGLVGKGINELIDLPGQSFLSGVQTGSQIRHKAEEGKWGSAAAVLPVGLAKGIAEAAVHPTRAPAANALMLLGGEATAGRLIGRVGRIGEKIDPLTGELTRRPIVPAFTRARKPVLLYGERAATETAPAAEGLRVVGRRYNPDPLRKAVQVVNDRRLYGQPVRAPTGELAFQARGAKLQREVSGGTFKVGAQDIASSGGEKTRRGMVRGTTNKIIRRQKEKAGEVVGTRPKLGQDAVPLIYQRAITTPERFVSDLRALRKKWQAAKEATNQDGSPLLTGADKAANTENVRRVSELLANKALVKHVAEKGWDSEPFRAAERIRQLHAPFVAARLFGGQLKEDQLRAALYPYAQKDMGAKHFTVEDHAAAEADALAKGEGRERAVAVSGRPPHLVEAHERAVGHMEGAYDKVKAAEDAVQGATRDYHRRVALQQSARARRAAAGETRISMPVEKRVMDSTRAALAQAKQELKEAQHVHREARESASEHPMPERQAALRGPHGEQLTNQMILDHMRTHGVPPPGYMSHVRGVRGRSSYFRSVLRQPKLERFTRTGSAFDKGTADHSWEALVGTVAKHASEAAQLEVRRRTLNRFAVGQSADARAGEAAAENFRFHPEGERVINALGEPKVVHIGSKQIVDKGHIAPVPSEDVLRQFGLAEHVTAEHRELGTHTIIPEHVLARMEAHDKALSSDKESGRLLQAYAQAWRKAKLNTSMPHVFGVLQEQAIRLAAEQAGPVSWATGRKLDRTLKGLAQVDKHGYIADSHGPLGERYRAVESVLGGRGGLAATQRWNDAVRLADGFQETSRIGRVMRAGSRGLHTPPGKAVWGAWRGWKALVEGGLGKAEEAAYHAHLGKGARELGVIDNFRSVLKAQEDGMRAMIDGRLTPNMADALARKVDDMMGNWTHQTPEVRKFVGKWAPFGLWYLNSLRWLYRLPVTHPVKTALLASIYQSTRAHREGEGQGIEAPHPVPNFLQGTIPVTLPLVGRVKVAPSYYSPGGTLGATAGSTAAEQLVPYLSSIYGALGGQSTLSKEKLRGPKGEELKPAQIALNTIAELTAGPTPLATQGQTLLQHGGKPFGTANWITDLAHALGAGPATVKPGTEHSLPETLGKMLSPTRVIRPKASAGEGSPAEVRDAYRKALRGPSSAERKESDDEVRKAYAEALGKR